MFCPTCGNESAKELNYCNRCGATLSLPTQIVSTQPIKLTVPSIVLGLTTIFGLGMIVAAAGQLANFGVPAGAIVAMVLFCAATLFGCVSMMIRFWTKLITLQHQTVSTTTPAQLQRQPGIGQPTMHQLPPRLEPVPSVTEHTTRTFSPVYSETSERGTKEY